MSARRRWAWPLVPVYAGVLALKNAWRAAGLSRARRLRWPVISVGSLSAGGAGKTPVVIALANLLSERGWTVDVLSRGYRRAGRGVERVDLLAAEPAGRFGDEPTLIAQRTGVPVWVGSQRYAAGTVAEAEASRAGQQTSAATGVRAHLLDDGLQHRILAREFELVLVTVQDLQDALLPAGNLREPLSALRRADAVVVREEEISVVEKPLRRMIRREVPVWTVRRELRFPGPLGVFGAGLRPLAFCALARPADFAAMLARAGCGVVDTVVYDDHHRYDMRDMEELIRLAKDLDASGLVTTEKDAVKLDPAMTARLREAVGPLMVVALEAHFVYESPVMRLLESRLGPQRLGVPLEDEVRSR